MTGAAPILGDLWFGLLRHLAQTTIIFALIGGAALLVRRGSAKLLDRIGWVAVAKLFLPAALFVPAAARLGEDSFLAPLLAGATVLDPLRVVGHGGRRAGAFIFEIGTLLYLTGAAVLVIRWIRLDRKTPRAAVISIDETTPEVRRRIDGARKAAGLPEERIRLLAGGGSPFVAGVLRPRVHLPEETARRLEAGELRGVLLHEAAHVHRREPLRGLVLRVAIVLFYYYPPLWILVTRIRATGELASDECALRRGADPERLADALAVTLCPEIVPGAAGWRGGGPSLTLRRLRRLRERRVRTMKHHSWVFAGVIALFVAGLVIPAAGDARVAVTERDGLVVMPRILKQVPPKYPAGARRAGVEGRVVLGVTVTEKGEAEEVKIAEETPENHGFGERAVEVMAEWEFEPGTVDGKPEAMTVLIPFEFRLHDEGEGGGEKKVEK